MKTRKKWKGEVKFHISIICKKDYDMLPYNLTRGLKNHKDLFEFIVNSPES